tara:strand:- start:11058 stop:11273 length:216 start_codon:yes stop_codon:yes gene_type:complete
MLPYEIKVEWYTQMYYNNKQVATEVMGSKVFYDKSPAYVAGYCQHFADKGYGVCIIDVNIKRTQIYPAVVK